MSKSNTSQNGIFCFLPVPVPRSPPPTPTHFKISKHQRVCGNWSWQWPSTADWLIQNNLRGQVTTNSFQRMSSANKNAAGSGWTWRWDSVSSISSPTTRIPAESLKQRRLPTFTFHLKSLLFRALQEKKMFKLSLLQLLCQELTKRYSHPSN